MREEQFNNLPSQGTIYSTSRLGNHLIIGTGDYGKVFAHISNTLVQEIPLQNMPRKLVNVQRSTIFIKIHLELQESYLISTLPSDFQMSVTSSLWTLISMLIPYSLWLICRYGFCICFGHELKIRCKS